jgi:DNA-binding NarL/FixJ family response regulator
MGRIMQTALKQETALSNREKEVLTLSAAGRSMDEIAHVLKISLSSVREHSRAATLKLSARTLTQAVATAMREGIIEGCGGSN